MHPHRPVAILRALPPAGYGATLNRWTPGRIAADAEVTADVLVIGSGVAGLVVALDVLDAWPGCRVVVLDKGLIGSAGSTPLAQGGMAAAVGPDDDPDRHAADTLRAGAGLGDPIAVGVMTAAGPARVADLERRGARFDRGPDGALSLSLEGGQSVARGVRAADATGAEIFRALRTAASGSVVRLQGVARRLALARDGRAIGAWALLDQVEQSPAGPPQDGGAALLRAGAVVLATGGCGGLYASTTNRDGATADGVALAWHAGAELVDMEFVQFHPTGLAIRGAGAQRLLLTEALRGAGAILVDEAGHRFMADVHPDAELAPRHIVTRAILDQPQGAWLDARPIGAAGLATHFPTVVAGAREHGIELADEPAPVEPVQHYLVGGVATDTLGRTGVPGLWAVGEVASTGVHGANRMAGNSLLQSCVFGHRTAEDIAAVRVAPSTATVEPPPLADPVDDPSELRAALRRALGEGAGPLRTAASLDETTKSVAEAAACLGPWAGVDRDGVELASIALVGGLIARAASLRTETRGVHVREDHPEPDPAWDGVRLRMRRAPKG